MPEFEPLRINALSEIDADKWNELVNCLEEVDDKIPDNRWKFNNLIIDNDTRSSALHFINDAFANSYISNRNNFVENGTSENNNLTISSANNIYFQTDSVDPNHGHNRLVIGKNGNIGVGTEVPRSKLHVKGNAGVLNIEGTNHAYLQFFPEGFDSGRKAWLGYGNSGVKKMTIMNANSAPLVLGTSGKERLIVESAGHIRVNSDSGWVDIGSKNNGYTHFYTNRPRYFFDKEIRVNSGKIGAYDEDLKLSIAGQTKLTISKANGNVGIGISTPVHKLHVNGGLFSKQLRTSGSLTVDGSAVIKGNLSAKILKGDILESTTSHKGGRLRSRGSGHDISFRWDDTVNPHRIRIYVGNKLVKSIKAWGEIG